ncbi:septum formation family protein [Actinoplanes sp. DH11]|uniref:septum formation family protein n=1 Tax=Actinoplanes sp. DH11 TaxID=2857011 RepID=UPI001E4F8696|nr:septum formation family protein [Actinoplanes sp. DH11]
MSAIVLLAAGCGGSSAVDGDLTNNWGAMAVATSFRPVAETCHLANFAATGPRSTYEEVDCEVLHRTETVFVGEYTGAAAEAEQPPAGASTAGKAAYRTCDTRTNEYAGGPWRHARLWIGVTNPSPAGWDGGARWFRCELVELDSIEDDGALVQRIGSLRGALENESSELMLTCYDIGRDERGSITTMPAVDCAQKHEAEFVGIWDAPAKASYPKGDATWEEFHGGCRMLVARYVGVPDDADLRYRTGVVSLPGNTEVWAQGDHGVRCYLWLEGAELTGSLKGKGTKALPVQYK